MLKMQHFVLNPKSSRARDAHAIASRAALRKYADWIADEYPEVAKGLKAWVNDEAEKALEFYRKKKPFFTRPDKTVWRTIDCCECHERIGCNQKPVDGCNQEPEGGYTEKVKDKTDG